MGKSHNRNQQKLNDNRVIDVTGAKGSPKNKPFIGVNVYTKEDDAIIKHMLQDPNWSVSKIKDALPYKHTTKNIMNKLLQFCSQKEIYTHIIDTKPAPEPEPMQTSSLSQMATIRKQPRWTPEETDILCKHINKLPLNSSAWKTLLPNRSYKAIDDKLCRLRKKMKKQETPKQETPKRIHGWLASDIELLKLALSEPTNQSLSKLMLDIIASLDEQHTAIEINKMVELLGLTLPKEPVETHGEDNMPNIQKSCTPTNDKLALLSQLCTLVEQFPESVTYDIHVNFGNGIYFDVNKPNKPEHNNPNIK